MLTEWSPAMLKLPISGIRLSYRLERSLDEQF